MKLSTYAKKVGISYQTAWKLYNQSHIAGYKLGTGTIIITELDNDTKPPKVTSEPRSKTQIEKDLFTKIYTYCLRYGHCNKEDARLRTVKAMKIIYQNSDD